jgi:hypothetical protein
MSSRSLPFAMAWLVMALLVTAAVAAEDNASNGAAATGDEYCIYTQGSHTDTPEIGPLPCDTSRPYMIGHSGLGSPRIPENSEFNFGPKSHLGGGDASPGSAESPERTEGTLASPPTPNANTDRLPDVEAP